MCGIAGTVGLHDPTIVERMIDAQIHRGPDDRGIHADLDQRVILGNCRLAILDLTAAGHMPMRATHQPVWITYNGEIYNYLALKHELEDKGYRFNSHSDTEVVLNAYIEWGIDVLARFRGIFAIAIYDCRAHVQRQGQGRLLLARDHFGIKPLYWTSQNNVLLFASEIHSLLASGLVERRLDRQAIWHYLSVGAVPPPGTILHNVATVLPGHYMLVQNGQIQSESFWDLRQSPAHERVVPPNLATAAQELRHLLDEVTQLQMVADVPVGAFLSGGIDSSAIVGLMSQHSARPLETFAIGFESQWQNYNELAWAKLVAEHFHTDHTEVVMNGQMVAEQFERLIQAIDQPSGDGVNSYFVAQATRPSVTVALSGLGGDELFAGYPQFRSLAWADQWMPQGSPVMRQLDGLWQTFPGRWRNMLRLLGNESLQRYSAVRLLYTAEEKQQWTNPSLWAHQVLEPVSSLYSTWLDETLDSIARTTYIEICGYMNYMLLRDMDAMSMAHSLEVRVPFLDPVLAQYAFQLPANLKLGKNQSKLVLKQALGDLLPPEILTRPKIGFEFPMKDWLALELKTLVHDVFALPEAKQVFNAVGLRHLLTPLKQSETYLRVWAPMVLIAWMHHYRCYLSE